MEFAPLGSGKGSTFVLLTPVFRLPRELLGHVSYRDTYLCVSFGVIFWLGWFCLVFIFQLALSLTASHLY